MQTHANRCDIQVLRSGADRNTANSSQDKSLQSHQVTNFKIGFHAYDVFIVKKFDLRILKTLPPPPLHPSQTHDKRANRGLSCCEWSLRLLSFWRLDQHQHQHSHHTDANHETNKDGASVTVQSTCDT